MSGGDWFLAVFALGPLVLFALLLALDPMAEGRRACHTCGHVRDRHDGGACRGPGPDPEVPARSRVTAATPCGCRSFAAPPREPPGPIGCGG
ncbi:hypothetical protein [Streptomyces sp. NPDC048606]|uniref:hypothetical protein n=1 Tax=Streptomyces sp. NPDC048606 TaxID=3154726 RepID=UPI003444B4AE